ncbi:DUF1345 domain-containing protein [Leifsonia lichenia]
MIAAFLFGFIVAMLTGVLGEWQFALITGWAGACVVYIVWVWSIVWRMDADETRSHATREDPGTTVSDLLLLIASLAGVVAIVFVLVAARQVHGAPQAWLALLAIASVALSWTLVHTIYTLRYARMYYHQPQGGIDFNQDEPPRYSDFAYVAFTLGMTFQVSDTNIGNPHIRRAILRHTLLSYLFGSVILATTVNLVAGLT